MASKDDPASRARAQPDWAAIEAAYTGTDMTVTGICALYGIKKDRLYAKARAMGWPRRSDRKARVTARDRIARLYEALDSQMADVQRRLAEAEGADGASQAGDRERDARTLATLARTLEKLNAMAPETPEQEADDTAPDDIEAFREELARRLAELRRQGGD
ncbi:MAG: hypothetical protein KDJ77_14765 [Rhodobiaceae bacterium]|nr:hypothetical protein [Rhodobiaceae bacterium]